MSPAERQAAIDTALAACAEGSLAPNLALMRVLITAASPAEAEARISAAPAAIAATPGVAQLRHLFAEHAAAWRIINGILSGIDHGGCGQTVSDLAAAFDRAAAISPEAAVALYSLGDADLLGAASTEIVARLGKWRLLAAERRVLDLGCGIGRLQPGLAARCEQVVGVEIAPRMAAIARSRCAGLDNVGILLCDAATLALADRSFDLIVAVDTFPYLVLRGGGAVGRAIAEAARILRPGGDLVLFNFSYRGDAARDRVEIARLAETAGFEVVRNGIGGLGWWDGLAFHLRHLRPGGSPASGGSARVE